MQFDSGFYHYIVDDKQIVACGGTHFETEYSAQLGNIHVIPQYRRQGLGYQLVKSITWEILTRKEMATLFVAQKNYPAISLYEKIGFSTYKPVNIINCSMY